MNFNYALFTLLNVFFCVLFWKTIAQFAPRTGHVSVTLNDATYLFGGENPETGIYYSDMWLYNQPDNTWKQVQPNGDMPDRRKGATATAINKNIWLLFGGDNGEEYFNDIFLFVVDTNTWLRGVPITPLRIPARSGHSAVTDGFGNIYIHGGIGPNGRLLNDLWIASLTPETILNRGQDFSIEFKHISSNPTPDDVSSSTQLLGQIPTARSGHSATFISNNIYIVGGFTQEREKEVCEVYRLTLPIFPNANFIWTRLIQQPPCPASREGHAVIRNGPFLYLSGGCDEALHILQCFKDFWVYHINENQWNDLSDTIMTQPTMVTFTPRKSHTLSLLDSNHLMFIGGSRLEFESFNSFHIAILNQLECSQTCFQTHGNCIETTCVCRDGYFGVDCGDIEFIGSQTNTVVTLCNNHGQLGLDGRCECYLGFSGTACEYGKNQCINQCSTHGICNALSQCECDSGYLDIDCSYLATCPGLCCHHGTCHLNGFCTCRHGYYGRMCSITKQQIIDMEHIIDDLKHRLTTILDKIDQSIQSASTHNSVHPIIETNLQDTTSHETLSSYSPENKLISELQQAKQIIMTKLSTYSDTMDYDDIATTYFTEADCISYPQPPHLDQALSETYMVSSTNNQDTHDRHSHIITSGNTATEQNNMKIQHSKMLGLTDHVMVPGPGNIAMEDVYNIAEHQLETQAFHLMKQSDIDSHLLTEYPSVQMMTYIGGSTATASPVMKWSLFLTFVAIGCSTIYGIHLSNNHNMKKYRQLAQQDNDNEVEKLLSETAGPV